MAERPGCLSRATTAGVTQVISSLRHTFPVFTRHPAYRCNAASGFHSERAGARLKLCAEAAPKFAIDVRTAGRGSQTKRASPLGAGGEPGVPVRIGLEWPVKGRPLLRIRTRQFHLGSLEQRGLC